MYASDLSARVIPATNRTPQPIRPARQKPSYSSVPARGVLLDKVWTLRYKSYSAEDYIEKNTAGRFMDAYDEDSLNTSYLTYYGGEAIGSIRACVFLPERGAPLPVMEPFGAEIRREIGEDKTLVEANRFVVDPAFQRCGGCKARFNIFTNVVDCAEYYNAAHVLAAVRLEHARFYRKTLGFEPLDGSSPRAYPGLNFKVVLLACDNIPGLRAVMRRMAG